MYKRPLKVADLLYWLTDITLDDHLFCLFSLQFYIISIRTTHSTWMFRIVYTIDAIAFYIYDEYINNIFFDLLSYIIISFF